MTSTETMKKLTEKRAMKADIDHLHCQISYCNKQSSQATDADMCKMYKQDAKDLAHIRDLVLASQLDDAYTAACFLDTAVRDMISRRLFNHLAKAAKAPIPEGDNCSPKK